MLFGADRDLNGNRIHWNGRRKEAAVESFYLTHRDRLLYELRQLGDEPRPIKFISIVPDEVGDGANVYVHFLPERKG